MHLSALSCELCGEARPLLFQPRLQAQQAGPDNWDGVGGVALRASWELPAYKGLRDKALSKQFSLEKLHLKRRAAGSPLTLRISAGALGGYRGLTWLPPPTLCGALPQEKKTSGERPGVTIPFQFP